MADVTISIPPAVSQTVNQGDQVTFSVTAKCTICFATNAQIPLLSGKTHTFNNVPHSWGPYTMPSVNTSIAYNVVAPPGECQPMGIKGTGSVIHVGSGMDDSKKHK